MPRTNLDTEKSQIIEMYKSGKTLAQIAKYYRIDRTRLSNFMRKELGISRMIPYGIPNTYFDIIDSNNKAYILGFIAADGAIVKNSVGNSSALTITIKYTDRHLLEFIRGQINPTSNLMEIKRVSSYDKNKQIHHIRFVYSNKHMIQSLINLGIDYNKSLTMPNIITNISKEFRNAFIIGYLDGDGSISLPKERGKYSPRRKSFIIYPSHRITLNFRGTNEFLRGIINELTLKGNINQYDSIPSLSIGDKSDVIKIFNCYEGLSFYLERKYSRFFPRINHPSYDIYKQVQTISSS